jgi:hypothetical protein
MKEKASFVLNSIFQMECAGRDSLTWRIQKMKQFIASSNLQAGAAT